MDEEGPGCAEKQGRQVENAIWMVSDHENGVAMVVDNWKAKSDSVGAYDATAPNLRFHFQVRVCWSDVTRSRNGI